MIEVFKTNVEEVQIADLAVAVLLQHFPDSIISFDLEDCDKVLRISGDCCPDKTKEILNGLGISCAVLD